MGIDELTSEDITVDAHHTSTESAVRGAVLKEYDPPGEWMKFGESYDKGIDLVNFETGFVIRINFDREKPVVLFEVADVDWDLQLYEVNEEEPIIERDVEQTDAESVEERVDRLCSALEKANNIIEENGFENTSVYDRDLRRLRGEETVTDRIKHQLE